MIREDWSNHLGQFGHYGKREWKGKGVNWDPAQEGG